MKTFRLLIKREFFQIFKFNKILHGERKERKKYISVLCTMIVAFLIFAVYWFRNIYQLCLEFQSQQELLIYLIRPLRLKIEPHPDNPRYIITVWGVGYKFSGEEKP